MSYPIQKRYCLCGCGRELTGRSNQKYATTQCRMKSRTKSRPFVALDGEGANDEYVLLAASNGKWAGRKSGLTTEECLDFLLALGRGSNSGTKPIYVWFAFDYDVNMILKDVPLYGDNSIEQLKSENTIHWRGYRITYIRRKIFRLARGKRRHTSYDIWGFFQASFEKSLSDWNIPSSKIIREGKAARGSFNRWSLQRIKAYNDAELIALAQLAEKLRESVTPLELPVQSWHGPAALAQAWFQKNKVKEWLGGEISEELRDAASRAYFGGRIDVLGYGIVNPVHHYDIVSAYPSATRYLPDLSRIEWKRHKGRGTSGRIYCSRIKWEIREQYWPPFPWRSHNGTIRYPQEGEGWYWFPEIESAQKKFGDRLKLKVIETWEAEGEYEFPFRNLIEETFAYRNQLKLAKDPSHIPVKLILNSLYGKFAQTVGKASYYSPIWAGLITSHTRAQLLDALTEDVVCVMTDSLWSRKPLQLDLGKQLGQWDKEEDCILYLAEAGLYQAEKPDGEKHTWQRGFDKRNPVDIPKLVSAWLSNDPAYSPTYKVKRFIGMGLGTVTHYPWRTWVEIQRKIEPVPFVGTTKRLPALPLETEKLSDTFVHLKPRDRDNQEISAPYKKATLDQALIELRLQDECEDE